MSSDTNMVIYISSRNNYEMLSGEVLKNVDLSEFPLINVDDGSTPAQQSLGRKICEENDIIFTENTGRGLHCAAATAIRIAKENFPNCKYVYWLTHDCYPMTEGMLRKLSDKIATGALDQFGAVGFNTIWKKYTMSEKQFQTRSMEGVYCGVMGRAVLTRVPGAGWYRPSDFSMSWNVWGKNIAVESVVDMNLMINVDTYTEHIETDDWFHHFCWGDDVCLQFLKAGVYNVTLGDFYVYHDQDLKSKYQIPANSFFAAKSGDRVHFSSHDRHYPRWEEKWGFNRDWQKAQGRLSPEEVSAHEGTLLHDFMTHDYRKGPLKTFDL